MDSIFEPKEQMIDIYSELNIRVKREAKNEQLINKINDNKSDVKREELKTGITSKEEVKSKPRSQSVSEQKGAEVVKRRRSEVEEYFLKQLINN